MKKISLINFTKPGVIALACVLALMSCNKPILAPIPIGGVSKGATLGEVITTDSINFTFFKALVIRAGGNILANFTDRNNSFTAYIPNDAAFIASGFPSIAAVNALPVASAQGIVNYSIVPGEILASTDIPTTFPNLQLPTLIVIGVLPGTAIPLTVSTFPSRRATGFWVNNIPAATLDQRVANGIIHIMQRVVAPPTIAPIKPVLFADPTYSLFAAAVARGDSGQTGLNKIDSALNFALANLTVFAPNNAAFNAIGITSAAQINGMPVQNARGLVVNHIMGSRAFSVNFTNAFAFYPTLLSSGIPGYPGVKVQTTFTGPFGTAMQVQSVGMGAGVANVTTLDRHFLNGVVHNIDKVLLP
jgi:uncharacterized surface protein with fasciclin (FAS1) repeats